MARLGKDHVGGQLPYFLPYSLAPSSFSLVIRVTLLNSLHPPVTGTVSLICIQTWMSFSYTVIVLSVSLLQT